MFKLVLDRLSMAGATRITGVVGDGDICRNRYGINGVSLPSFEGIANDSIGSVVESFLSGAAESAQLRETIQNSSLLVIAGGGSLTSAFPSLLAQRLVVTRIAKESAQPVVLLSQGLGPLYGEHEREVVSEILGHASLLSVREWESWALALSLGFPAEHLYCTGDEVLSVPVQPASQRDVLILSLDSHLLDSNPDLAQESVRNAAELAIRHSWRIVILPQTFSDEPETNSDEAGVALLQSWMHPDVPCSVLASRDLSEVAEYVAMASLVISSRYHPIVLATRAATPCVFVSTSPDTYQKGHGAIVLSGANGLALKPDADAAALKRAISDVLTSLTFRPDLSTQTLRELAEQRGLVYERTKALVQSGGRPPLSKIAVCTIISSNYRAQASVLKESVLSLHPFVDFKTLLIDVDEDSPDAAEMGLASLGIENEQLMTMAAMYSVTEFATALKPSLLQKLLDDGYEQVWYLDPDIQVLAPLTPVLHALKSHAVVLTPHALTPFPNDLKYPRESLIRQVGIFNLGFIGVQQSARAFLSWWANRLRTDAIIDLPNGLFTDQRWVDFAPSLTDVAVLRHPGMNVAYWNLQERQVTVGPSGSLRVNDAPMFFYHFSGFDPLDPHVISRHVSINPRASVFDSEGVEYLFSEYRDGLLRNGFAESVAAKYRWSVAVDGTVLDPLIRRTMRAHVVATSRFPPSPFSSNDVAAWREWLDETLGVSWASVPSQLRAMWFERDDFQREWASPCGADAQRFLRWASENKWIDPEVQALCRQGLRTLSNEVRGLRPVGFNLIGYFNGGMGIGEAGRRLTASFVGTGLPHHVVALPATLTDEAESRITADRTTIRYANSIVMANADSVDEICSQLGLRRHSTSKTVGVWFWELEEFPQKWKGAFKHFDELWVASTFMQRALSKDASIPVHRFTMEVPVFSAEQLPSREDVGFDGRFTFFFTYDANSIFQRKNPLGTIEAFRHAFRIEDGARLVIRVTNAARHPGDYARLRAAISGRPDIELIAARRSNLVTRAEITRADCFISLHRSEGFGLNIATALAAGTPTIATNYSGNLDFMDSDSSWLVDYDHVRVGEGSDPYDPQAWWAEPSLAHAIETMREVVADPNRILRAERGRRMIQTQYSFDRAVDSVKSLLNLEGTA